MKLFITLFATLAINFCFAQTNTLAEKFLSSLSDKYTQEELNESTQYYRMLMPIRKSATFTKAVALKSNVSHLNKNSRFLERNQLIGLHIFEYPSKKVCQLAVDSLLKCFPNYCINVKNEPLINEKLTPSVYVINSKTIFCVETFCEDVNEQWELIVKKAIDTFADNNSKIIYTECGKLTWTTKENWKK